MFLIVIIIVGLYIMLTLAPYLIDEANKEIHNDIKDNEQYIICNMGVYCLCMGVCVNKNKRVKGKNGYNNKRKYGIKKMY